MYLLPPRSEPPSCPACSTTTAAPWAPRLHSYLLSHLPCSCQRDRLKWTSDLFPAPLKPASGTQLQVLPVASQSLLGLATARPSELVPNGSPLAHFTPDAQPLCHPSHLPRTRLPRGFGSCSSLRYSQGSPTALIQITLKPPPRESPSLGITSKAASLVQPLCLRPCCIVCSLLA